jgi:molecular chaperone HscB
LNDAYRTLKNPVARIEYLLGLELGADGKRSEAAGGHNPKVPAGLLEEVFALNEELDEIREMKAGGAPRQQWAERLERARQPIEAKRQEHESQLERLSAQWDSGEGDRRAVLAALNERILERNYIANLLAGIEKELQSPDT